MLSQGICSEGHDLYYIEIDIKLKRSDYQKTPLFKNTSYVFSQLKRKCEMSKLELKRRKFSPSHRLFVNYSLYFPGVEDGGKKEIIKVPKQNLISEAIFCWLVFIKPQRVMWTYHVSIYAK